jgi:2-aminoadipate transaminase
VRQVDALEARLRAGDVPGFVYTIPFFHNPTGAVLPSSRCERLVALARKYGFYVVADEPYNFLHLDGPPLPSLASYDDSGRVVSLGSFSKILAPGLRLGACCDMVMRVLVEVIPQTHHARCGCT